MHPFSYTLLIRSDHGAAKQVSFCDKILGSRSLLISSSVLVHTIAPTTLPADVPEIMFGKHFISSNVIAYIAVPLQSKGVNVGYIIIHWCSDEKVSQVKEQFASEEMKYAKDRIEVQLGHQIALGNP